MSSDLIQSDYDSLVKVASRFAAQTRNIEKLHTTLSRQTQNLARSWEGAGSQAFQREMQSIVFPAVQRLVKALAQGEQTTRKISQTVRQAEQEAEKLFKSESTTNIPTNESTGGGGGGASGGGGSEPIKAAPSGGDEPIKAAPSGGGGGGGGFMNAAFTPGGDNQPQFMNAAFTPGGDNQPRMMFANATGGDGATEGGADASTVEATSDGVTEVDWSFISAREGGQLLDGYVPASDVSKSGVTVGTGIDIGQRSTTDIDNLDIPDTLKEKLKPYTGMIKKDAEDYLAANPLTITKDEADSLDKAVKKGALDSLVRRYDNATTGTKFADLPAEMQTVIASAEFQYGSLATKTPKFWGMVTEQRWDDAIAELRDFGDKYPTRRGLEADLMQQGVDNNPAPASVTPTNIPIPQPNPRTILI